MQVIEGASVGKPTAGQDLGDLMHYLSFLKIAATGLLVLFPIFCLQEVPIGPIRSKLKNVYVALLLLFIFSLAINHM